MLFGNRQKYLDNLGIKLGPRAAFDFLARVRHWQSLTVGPVTDHRVHTICNREYPGPKRDLFALQSTWIGRRGRPGSG